MPTEVRTAPRAYAVRQAAEVSLPTARNRRLQAWTSCADLCLNLTNRCMVFGEQVEEGVACDVEELVQLALLTITLGKCSA
eukprot:467428-Pelagomonas_calceolata.AAC.3